MYTLLDLKKDLRSIYWKLNTKVEMIEVEDITPSEANKSFSSKPLIAGSNQKLIF